MSNLPLYGDGDSTYKAMGEAEGIERLVTSFYRIMATNTEFLRIRSMHSKGLDDAHEKLVAFLSGWSGGPKLFAQKFGNISLPVAHKHLPIETRDMQAWLDCMAQALAEQPYPEVLQAYLLKKFATPAESIRLMCEPPKPGLQGDFYDPV